MDKPLFLKSTRTLRITYNLPISRTLKFWKGLEEGKLHATKCRKCRTLHFPPVADCGVCGSSEVDWVELDGEGELVTFTQVFAKPASFLEESPYIVAIARLKEGMKVLAWLTGIKREDVKVGMKVKVVSKIYSKDRIAYELTPLKIW